MDPDKLLIMSGGQTGVDRAALDAALALGFKCGGYCPAGRQADDGRIPAKYPLTELPNPSPAVRTLFNVNQSNGTLILYLNSKDLGTQNTIMFCQNIKKPYLEVNFADPTENNEIIKWLDENSIYRLNIAGPKEKNSPGIYAMAKDFLMRLLMA